MDSITNPSTHVPEPFVAACLVLLRKKLRKGLSMKIRCGIIAYHWRNFALFTKFAPWNPFYTKIPGILSRKHSFSCRPEALSKYFQRKLYTYQRDLPIDSKKEEQIDLASICDPMKNPPGPTKLKQCLDVKCRDQISRAGASIVNLDLRPIKFAENYKGIALFMESIFKSGLKILCAVPINRKSHLLTKTLSNLSGAFLSAIIWRTN